MATPSDKPIDLATSVAGEEDPGASVDMALGDEAPRGTPGTGEKPCPSCGGTGQLGGRKCPECEGTGTITAGVGGG